MLYRFLNANRGPTGAIVALRCTDPITHESVDFSFAEVIELLEWVPNSFYIEDPSGERSTLHIVRGKKGTYLATARDRVTTNNLSNLAPFNATIPPASIKTIRANWEVPGIIALSGWVEANLEASGAARFRGHTHDSGLEGYRYRLASLVTSSEEGWHLGADRIVVADVDGDGQAELIIPKGEWLGVLRWQPGEGLICDPWMGHQWVHGAGQSGTNALLQQVYPQLTDPRLHVTPYYKGTITSQIEGLADLLIGWVLGFALMPALLTVAIIGEIGSLAITGSAIPGAQLLGEVCWLLGPAGILFGVAASVIADLGEHRRPLTDEEWMIARAVFGETLPDPSDLVITDAIGGGDRAFTWPSGPGPITINMGQAGYSNAISYKVGLNQASGTRPHVIKPGEILVHELVHAWQMKNTSMERVFLARAVATQLGGLSVYDYTLDGRDFSDYGVEEQAQIISDWFALTADVTQTSSGLQVSVDNPKAVADPAYRYVILNIRTGAGA